MFFIPGAVFTTEHIHKSIKDGFGLEVHRREASALHRGSIECAISGFRRTGVRVFWLHTNLFLSSLQELCSTQILPQRLVGAQLFKPRLEFARMIPLRFPGNSSLQCKDYLQSDDYHA
jgi:hypothetical protein